MPSEFRIAENMRNQQEYLNKQIETEVYIPLMMYFNDNADEIDLKYILKNIRKFDKLIKVFINNIKENEALSRNTKGIIIRDVEKETVQPLKCQMNHIKAIYLEKEFGSYVSDLNKICNQLFSQKAIDDPISIMNFLTYLRTKLTKIKHRLLLDKGLYYSSKVKPQDINLEIKYIDIVYGWLETIIKDQSIYPDNSYNKLREKMIRLNVSGTLVSSQLTCLDAYPRDRS